MVDRGGFDYILSHDIADKELKDLERSLAESDCTIGYEIYWTLGQNPQ